MQLVDTDIDERLDLLENMENGEVFFYDLKTGHNAFCNKTVAKLIQNSGIAHSLIVFEEGISRQRVERTMKKIGKTLKKFKRVIVVDAFFHMDSELFDILRAEYNV